MTLAVPHAHRAVDLTPLLLLDADAFMTWYAAQVDPAHAGDRLAVYGTVKAPVATERLMEYWAHGTGATKIRWGVPGDFNRCRAHLGKYVKPTMLAGLCANLHHRALGVWPGQEDGGRK